MGQILPKGILSQFHQYYPSRSYDHYHDRYGRPRYTSYRYRRDVDEDENEENESGKQDEAERLSPFEKEDFEEASLDQLQENTEEQENINEKEDFEEASLNQIDENTEETENFKEVHLPQEHAHAYEQELRDG